MYEDNILAPNYSILNENEQLNSTINDVSDDENYDADDFDPLSPSKSPHKVHFNIPLNDDREDNTTSQFPSSTHSELVCITWCPCHCSRPAIILKQNQGADFGKLQLLHDTAINAPQLQIHFQLIHTMMNDKAFDP